MEIAVDTPETNTSNLFLRALWAEFRRTCGKCAWNFIPHKDGPSNRIHFGHCDLGRPEGCLEVSISYNQRGTIKNIRFELLDGLQISAQSELGIIISNA